MNLRSLRNDLAIKENGLGNAKRTLKVFLKEPDKKKNEIREVREIIHILECQIVDIKKNIKELEKRAQKK